MRARLNRLVRRWILAPGLTLPASRQSLCKFLKSEAEVGDCMVFLHRCGFILHPCAPKNWDLAHMIPSIGDGNLLDMGSWESYVLVNVALKGIRGEMYGIDLQSPTHPIKGVHYMVGDLTNTGLPDQFFANITCVSVIEHGVDIGGFVREAARLLRNTGKLLVSFDYWEPRVRPAIQLYGLGWQPLDRKSVEALIAECGQNDLFPVSAVDWTLGAPVVREGYCSPDPSVRYTFGLMVFEKRSSERRPMAGWGR